MFGCIESNWEDPSAIRRKRQAPKGQGVPNDDVTLHLVILFSRAGLAPGRRGGRVGMENIAEIQPNRQ